MSEHTKTPKLVMGYIEVMGPNDESGIPYDEAVIHFEGDEDSEIEIHCSGALRLAPIIVKAVNRDHHFDALVKALERARDAIKSVYGEIDNPAMPACLAAAWEVADLALTQPDQIR